MPRNRIVNSFGKVLFFCFYFCQYSFSWQLLILLLFPVVSIYESGNKLFFIADEVKFVANIFFFIAVNPHEAKLTYKEDTKLEDRLAMEAEEEKKFSNGDTYDEGEGEDKSTASSTSSASSLSPKEQASQEMQVNI